MMELFGSAECSSGANIAGVGALWGPIAYRMGVLITSRALGLASHDGESCR